MHSFGMHKKVFDAKNWLLNGMFGMKHIVKKTAD